MVIDASIVRGLEATLTIAREAGAQPYIDDLSSMIADVAEAQGEGGLPRRASTEEVIELAINEWVIRLHRAVAEHLKHARRGGGQASQILTRRRRSRRP